MLVKQTASLALLGAVLTYMLGVAGLAIAVEIGQKAPDFALKSTEGKKISLSQFQGKKHVLMEFYVADFGVT